MYYLFGSKDYAKESSLLWQNFLFLALLGVCLQFVTSFLLSLILNLMPKVKADYLSAISGLTVFSAAVIIYVAIVAPLAEELVFRGLAYFVLEKILPVFAVILIQALAFGLLHANIVQKVYAIILGILLGYIRYRTGNLVSSMVVHMFVNGTGIVMSAIPAYSENDGIHALTVCSAIIALIVGILSFIKLNKVWSYSSKEGI